MKVWLLFNSERCGGVPEHQNFCEQSPSKVGLRQYHKRLSDCNNLENSPPFANLGEPRLVHATAQQTALAFVATPCPIYFVEMLNWRPIRFLLMTDSPLQKTAGDSEGDTPLAHARYFNAPDLYKLYSGNGATIAGPFYARLLGAYWGPFRTCAAHVLPLFFQSFLCGFANRGGKTPVNALFMPCVWCTICEQNNDTKSAVVIRIEGGCLFQIAHVFSSFLMTSSKGCFKLALKDDSRPSGSVRPDAVWSSSRAAVQQWPSWKSCVRW